MSNRTKTWYGRLNGIARTPGHETPGRHTAPDLRSRSGDLLRCFSCHSTGPLKISELGVRCEGCHGPAASHIQAPARVRPRNPGKFTADQLNAFCGQCHRMPGIQGDTTDLKDPGTRAISP